MTKKNERTGANTYRVPAYLQELGDCLEITLCGDEGWCPAFGAERRVYTARCAACGGHSMHEVPAAFCPYCGEVLNPEEQFKGELTCLRLFERRAIMNAAYALAQRLTDDPLGALGVQAE